MCGISDFIKSNFLGSFDDVMGDIRRDVNLCLELQEKYSLYCNEHGSWFIPDEDYPDEYMTQIYMFYKVSDELGFGLRNKEQLVFEVGDDTIWGRSTIGLALEDEQVIKNICAEQVC